jgi:prepilin-type N-terminal cleavage/methylation domain-containing protein
MDYKFMSYLNIKNFGRKKGFTLIELLVVVAIIALLISVVMASLNTARSKARFAQVIEIMHSIEEAATLDYNDNSIYAADVNPSTAPSFIPKYLPNWPTPPCSNFTFDWENWNSGQSIGITLRDASSSPVFHYTIYDTVGGMTGDGTDIKTATNRILTCSE